MLNFGWNSPNRRLLIHRRLRKAGYVSLPDYYKPVRVESQGTAVQENPMYDGGIDLLYIMLLISLLKPVLFYSYKMFMNSSMDVTLRSY